MKSWNGFWKKNFKNFLRIERAQKAFAFLDKRGAIIYNYVIVEYNSNTQFF